MNEKEIEELFNETIHKTRGLSAKLNGFSKDTVYNWKTGRTTPPLGDMLSVLYQLNLINVESNG